MSKSSTSKSTISSLHTSSNQSLLEKTKINKINKINKNLFSFAKEEITSLSSLKVKIYKDEIEDEKDENKIKILKTFKIYFEDYKKCKGIINQIESGIINSLNIDDSTKVEQVNSSDLVNSD